MVYFSDYFKVPKETLNKYGAFNISLINDLPVFIDPFLLFGSKRTEYQRLHESVLKYISFLKEKSEAGEITDGEKKAWFMFPEVEQTWLGFSVVGNSGRGLGPKFANSLSANISSIFPDLGNEKIAQTSHLEKAALFQIGMGKDNISDFTTNLIKSFLLKYTEKFAVSSLNSSFLSRFSVEKVYFDYEMERWMPQEFLLPKFKGTFVLLTPLDILTKDENWINSGDMHNQFNLVCKAIPNSQLRSEVNNYFKSRLPKLTKKAPKPTQKERTKAIIDTISKFPEIIDHYIKLKETNKEGAQAISKAKVQQVTSLFVDKVSQLIEQLKTSSGFYDISPRTSFDEALTRVSFMKDVIEKNDGYKIFYVKNQPIKREEDLQIIFRLTWFASDFDVNREVNNGRGPVDYAISKGAADKTLVEFKLASNSQLKRNLLNQVKIYQEANANSKGIKVILYFSLGELQNLKGILKELKLQDDPTILLIDARRDNKQSASKV